MKNLKIIFLMTLVITFLVAVIPDMAEAHTITERTVSLDLTSNYVTYAGGAGTGNPAADDIIDSDEGWKWYLYENTGKGYEAKTLVLEGISLSTVTEKALIVPADTTIIIKGINNVTSIYRGAGSSYGLYACGALTITGESDQDDILTITGGNPKASFTVTSFGLYVMGDLIMNGGHVEAIGGDGRFSRGISVNADLMVTGGRLYGMGGVASDGSTGLWINGTKAVLTLSKGILSVTGGTTTMGSSYGLYGLFCTINITGGDFMAAGGTGKRNSFGVHILPSSKFTFSGDTMVLKGNDMAINITPMLDGSYEYKINNLGISEPSGNWIRGKINNFLPCKYVIICYDKPLKPEIELG